MNSYLFEPVFLNSKREKLVFRWIWTSLWQKTHFVNLEWSVSTINLTDLLVIESISSSSCYCPSANQNCCISGFSKMYLQYEVVSLNSFC